MTGVSNAPTHLLVRMLDMRAQATAAGLVQLAAELRNANILSGAALEHIKDAIAEELAEHAPRSMTKQAFTKGVRERLDRVFAGCEPVGQVPADFVDPAGQDHPSSSETYDER